MKTAIHYERLGFTVVYDNDVITAKAYKIIACDEAGILGYQRDDSDFGPDVIWDTDGAEHCLEAFVKTDGCANWMMQSRQGYMHTCELSEVENYASLMVEVYRHLMSIVDNSQQIAKQTP